MTEDGDTLIFIYTNLWSGKGKWRETSSFERDVGCLATREYNEIA